LRSQSRSAVGWILAPALIAALWLPGGAAADPKTGQSPHCKRFCMMVEPHEGPEGSVFRFEGRGWLGNRKVTVTLGPYCRPDDACPAIAQIITLSTNAKGRFVLKLRAGQAHPGDQAAGIRSGGGPSFSQRTVTRRPRYRVIVPECGDCG
jgi:hypothetical protein